MVRAVTIRTTRSAQAASDSLRQGAAQAAVGPQSAGVEDPSKLPGFLGTIQRAYQNASSYSGPAKATYGSDKDLYGGGAVGAGGGGSSLPAVSGALDKFKSAASIAVSGFGDGGDAARAAAAAATSEGLDPEVQRLKDAYARTFLLPGADDNIDDLVQGQWDILESVRLVQEAMAAQMIDDAVAQAALGYDEKLVAIGRSIDDTRGRLTDLDKITDYYLASLVEPWRQAADAAKGVDSQDVKSLMAGRLVEIGEMFDVADENTQAYLDRIGGVPVAQKIAINDMIRETQNPFEGLVRADMAGMVAITDAQGNVLERQAEASLAHATFEGEAQRFVTAGVLGRDLDRLYQDRNDTIANRDKAVDLAKRQANAQYGYTGTMPEKDAFIDSALTSLLSGKGFDQIDQAESMQMFSQALAGQSSWFLDSYQEDAEGNPLGQPIRITSQAQLESVYATMPQDVQSIVQDDFDILQDMFATYESSGREWDGQMSYSQSTGGRSASANRQNWIDQTPSYVQRQQYVQSYIPMIQEKFPAINSIQQMRPLDMYNPDSGQSANSDHYSGGALDLMISDKAEGDRIVAWLKTLPTFNYAVWQKPNHYDHIHVSFLLPDQIGQGQPVGTFLPAEGAHPAIDDERNNGVPADVRSALSGLIGAR